jgi:hypothetical protein
MQIWTRQISVLWTNSKWRTWVQDKIQERKGPDHVAFAVE